MPTVSPQRTASSAGPGLAACRCKGPHGRPRFIVITGGPGAGKTAVLELARQQFCQHVLVLAEAASLLFGGGFPRRTATAERRATQRAIYHVQVELEAVAREESDVGLVLCDRGTLDGLAYWPEPLDTFWTETGTTWSAELARYDGVICLGQPPLEKYNHQNPFRIETAQQALEINVRIREVWAGHPSLTVVQGTDGFLDKARAALERIALELPSCCRESIHAPVPALGEGGSD